MKKINLLIAFLVLFSMGSLATADDSQIEIDSVDTLVFDTVINEYNLLSMIAENDESVLLENGYSLEEINQIKNYEDLFQKHILNINETYSDQELTELGYTENDIELIRNYDFSTRTNEQLAANCSLKVYNTTAYKYNSSKNMTNVTIKYEFNWTRLPTITLTDQFGLGWNNSSLGATGNGRSNVIVSYYNGASFVKNKTYISQVKGSNGIECQFRMDDTNPLVHARKGVGTVTLEQTGRDTAMRYYAYYVHNKGSVPSITVGPLGLTVPGITSDYISEQANLLYSTT